MPPAPTPMHLPSVQAPKIPQLTVPAPSAGKSAKKKGGWTAYIPLIVILNLLLLAGVGLVLYFIFVH